MNELEKVARVVVKEFEETNVAESPTPNFYPALELLRETIQDIDAAARCMG